MDAEEFAKKLAQFDQDTKHSMELMATSLAEFYSALVNKGLNENVAYMLTQNYHNKVMDRIFDKSGL